MMKHLLALVLLCFALSSHGEGGLFGKGTPPQAGAATFGALAFNAKSRAWAYVVKSVDKTRAMVAVAKLCPDCVAYGPFEHCGVIASNGTNVGYGFAVDRLSAERDAMERCGGAGCDIAVWSCNHLAATEETAFRSDTVHPRNFGAVTYDENTRAFGTVWDHGSFSAAVAAAKTYCGRDCRIYIAQAGDCGVLARGTGSIAIGTGGDYKAAEDMALAKCGPSCEPVTWFCNSAGRM